MLNPHYQIVEVLSTGGEEEIFLAKDKISDSSLHYLVKKFRSTSKQSEKLFLAQAQALQKLSQENEQIQKLLNYFEDNQEFYLVQELVDGTPLAKEIFQGQLQEELVISILSQVLQILKFVHSKGIIHQDINPENIIRRHTDSKLVLTNFGSVKQAMTDVLELNDYMPMEQFNGNPQPNSDIYALGIVAIVALTGLPAREITSPQSPRNFLTGEIVWRHRSTKVSGRLARIINRMVHFDYRNRYESSTVALQDLEKLTNKYLLIETQRQEKRRLLIFGGVAGFIIIAISTWFLFPFKGEDAAKKVYEQGVIKYEQANYKSAINYFNQATWMNPKYGQAYNKRGDAYYRLGDYLKSQEDYSEAIRLNNQDANAYYDRGFTLYKLDDYVTAIVDYNKAIQINPEYADAYYGRGLARYKIKDRQAAMADFNKAIALNPQYAEAYTARGVIHRKQGNKLQAIKDLEEATRINPDDAEAHYELGVSHENLNEKRSAIKSYTKAIELNPNYLNAYLARADVYGDMGYGNKAMADYSKAIALNPTSPEVYTRRGIFHSKRWENQAAFANFNKALQLDPKYAPAYNYLAITNLDMGKIKQARYYYSKAIEVNPSYALAYYNRGLIHTNIGKVPQAIEDFQKAAQLFLEKDEKSSYDDAKARIKELTPNG